jgi:hypothetical protein
MPINTLGPVWYSGSGFPANLNPSNLAHNGSRVVAVGRTMAGAATTTGAYSDNGGKTWVSMSMPSREYANIVWAPGPRLFIATCGVSATAATYCTSPDGLNWTSRTTPGGGNGYWYAVGANDTTIHMAMYGGTVIYNSTDGVTWGSVALGVGTNTRRVVAGGIANNWVMGGETSPYARYSLNNGTSWPNSSGLVYTILDLAYLNGHFYRFSGNNLGDRSVDGSTWSSYNYSVARAHSVPTFLNGLFIAGGGSINAPEMSLNGTNWQVVTNLMPSTGFWNIWTSATRFVGLIGHATTPLVAYTEGAS